MGISSTQKSLIRTIKCNYAIYEKTKEMGKKQIKKDPKMTNKPLFRSFILKF